MHVAPNNVKVAWLREHRDVWQAFPENVPPCTRLPRRLKEVDTYRIKRRWIVIVAAMKHDGLVRPTTWTGDVRLPALMLAMRRTTGPTPCDTCERHKSCFVAHVHGVRSRRTSTRAVRAKTDTSRDTPTTATPAHETHAHHSA
jgi:hypothetical protein